MSDHTWPGLPTQITIESRPDGTHTWAAYPVDAILPPNTTLVLNIRLPSPDKQVVGHSAPYVRRTGLALVEIWEIDQSAVPEGDPPDVT